MKKLSVRASTRVAIMGVVAWTSQGQFPCPEPGWLPAEPVSALDTNPLGSVVWDPDGEEPLPEAWVAVGSMRMAHDVPVNGVAMWDGQVWSPLGLDLLGPASATNTYVANVHNLNGELVVVGTFGQGGASPIMNIASWDIATQSWKPFGAGLGTVNDRVYAAVLHGSVLVATGDFVNSGATKALRIAQWNGAAWAPLGTGLDPNSSVKNSGKYGVALQSYNGSLYVGGSFDKAGSVGAFRIARWDGTAWSAVGSGPLGGSIPSVTSFAIHKDSLIVGGVFTTMNGVPAMNVAAWNGTAWSPLGAGISGGASGPAVECLRVIDSTLYAGGPFTGSGIALVASWDGAKWSGLPGQGPVTQFSASGIRGIDTFGGEIHVAGSFSQIFGAPVRNVARWNGVSTWQPIGQPGTDWMIEKLLEHDGNAIAMGQFTTSNGTSKFGVFDGTDWSPFPPTSPGWSTPKVAVSTSQGLIVSGIGASALKGIAQWNGSAWTPLGSGLAQGTLTRWAFDLIETLDGVIAGGDFETAGGLVSPNVARWDGTQWHAMGTGITGASNGGLVQTLLHWQGQVIAGGQFDTAGGLPAANIALWDGTAWSPMSAGLMGSGIPVRALAEWNGNLIAAGESTKVLPGNLGGDIARWNPTTQAWEVLASGNVFFHEVNALRVWDGKLLVGGNFKQINGVPIKNLAVFDGTTWAPFQGGANAEVMTIGEFAGNLTFGGYFSAVGTPPKAAGAFAWFGCPLPPLCYPDCDLSGSLDIDDFICFQTLYALGDPKADCDASGSLDIDDFICFQTLYAIGC